APPELYTLALHDALPISGHHDRARGLLAQGLAGVPGCGNLRLELLLRSATAVAAYLRGAWEGLPESLERLAGEVSNFPPAQMDRSEEHTSELQSRENLVC